MRPVHVALALDSASRQTVSAELGAAGFSAQFVRDPAQLLSALPEIELLLLGRPPRIDWSSAARLRLLHVAGAGVDPLLPALGLRAEVVISNCRGVHSGAVRDHVFGLLLAFARDLPRAFTQQQSRTWQCYPMPALSGRALCVVGLGEIGRRVCDTALSFGMQVRGVSRSGSAHAGVSVTPTAGLQAALQQADYVALCLPLTAQTHRLFDDAMLAALPAHGVLISVARGGIVDEVALEARLRAGELRGAALDVFEHEPLPPSSSLWDCPGLLLTPHSAGYTPDYLHAAVQSFIDAAERTLRGQQPLTLISREHEY
jgi:phosphoglycerate dehydrogenase-like enzyme